MLDRGVSRGGRQVPYLRNQNVQWGRFDLSDVASMELLDEELERFAVLPGDLLVCEGGEVGRSALWPGSEGYVAYQKALHRVRPRDELDSRYLRYWLAGAAGAGVLARHSTGSTIKHLPQAALRELRLPLPPRDEQRRMVAVLDDHLSRLEAAQGYLSSSERRLRLLKRAMLQREFHDLRAAETPTVKLGDIAGTALGKMLDATRASGEPTRYLRNSNVRCGHIDLDDVATVPLDAGERQRFALAPGDLLVCEGGEPGRCAVWQGSDGLMTYQKALHRVRVHSGVEVELAAAALQEFVQSPRAARVLTGTTIKHLPQERLRRIELPLPDRAEQQRIVAAMKEIDAAAERTVADLTPDPPRFLDR